MYVFSGGCASDAAGRVSSEMSRACGVALQLKLSKASRAPPRRTGRVSSDGQGRMEELSGTTLGSLTTEALIRGEQPSRLSLLAGERGAVH